MILSNEDNTLVADTSTNEFKFEIIHSPSKASTCIHPTVTFRKGIYEIAVINNLDIGYYQLRIIVLPCDENEIIFGFISDVFEVIGRQNESDLLSIPLLKHYRELVFQSVTVMILEEYGETMGSHIWDSGYILTKYLLEEFGKMEGTIIELGAGCGILGISLNKLFDEKVNVIMTDRYSQKNLIQQNIQLNDSEANCSFSELDWANQAHISNLQLHVNGVVDFIVAADVIYDEDSIEPLIHLIRMLNPLRAVFLAQKARKGSDLSLAHCQSRLSEMNWDVVHESHDVRVWQIMKK